MKGKVYNWGYTAKTDWMKQTRGGRCMCLANERRVPKSDGRSEQGG
jgi:hypothetical protein